MVDFKKILPKKREEEEYYWSLLIEPGWVQAGIWKIEDKKARVIVVSPATPWNSNDDLLSSSDTALSSAIQSFPENLSEPSKTVFGVSSGWVDKGQIGAEYLEKIKKLCGELSLTPIGFVVLPEAIAHYKKYSEGAPLNAVTLGIYKENLEISIFSMGNLLGNSRVARSVSLDDDVGEGLSRFATGISIPSRFLLYDGREGELEDAQQSLMKVNWDDFDKFEFLHTPKIEIIDVEIKIHAVCLAGASELAGVNSLEIADEFREMVKDREKSGGLGFAKPNESPTRTSVEDLPADFSSKDADVGIVEVKNVFGETGVDEIEDLPEGSGFVVDKDISSGGEDFAENEEAISQEIAGYHQNIKPVAEKTEDRKNIAVSAGGFKEKLMRFKTGVISVIPKLKMPGGSGISAGKKIFAAGFLFILILMAVGFVLWWFVPRATVTIYLSSLNLSESSDISVSEGGTTDLAQGNLAGETISVSVSGEKTKDATGTKTVGDKAKGSVILYRVGSEITLDSGTVINGPEGLKFTLDSDIQVASGSSLLSPGETSANVTAQDIGAEYNLAGGATFSVSNYSTSEMVAENSESFSGGSSREISAVSAEDMEVLEEDLLEELAAKAKEDLLGKLAAEKYLIEESLVTEVSSKDFSDEEEDEASTLKLSMEVDAKAVVVDKKILNDYTLEYLSAKVPEGYVLREQQVGYEFDFKGKEDGVYKFRSTISANLLPEIDKEEIVRKLRGKYPKMAEEYLDKELSGFVRAEIRIKTFFPEKLKTLPHIEKNIEVEFTADK